MTPDHQLAGPEARRVARPPVQRQDDDSSADDLLSAIGNQGIAQLAARTAEPAEAELPEDAALDLVPVLDQALAAPDEPAAEDAPVEEPAVAQARGATPRTAILARLRVARQPKTKTPPRTRPLTNDDVADLKRVGTRTLGELVKLESERAITTVEAEEVRGRIQELMSRSTVGRGDHRALVKTLNAMRAYPAWARKRAAAMRSTKGKKLVSDFKVTPPVIRVSEHEAARISFVVKGSPQHISAYILSDPDNEGTSYRFFNIDAKAGYHQVIWDGTFEGSRNKPPEAGVYRIEVSVTDADGKTENVYEQIRVENPDQETVLPRVASGLSIARMHFDGHTFTLTDEGGNTIESRATSGLKPNNPHNTEKKDFTDPKYQLEEGRGPIPEHTYTVAPGQFQVPDEGAHHDRYLTGGSRAGWGPMRVHLLPNEFKGRSQFFLHLDVGDDGTAGCIGFPPSEEGKFNQIMSLIATSKSDAKLTVEY
jgi:hypothetical protein